MDLLHRELEIFRTQRGGPPPHRRPDDRPAQRLAILQLRRLRGWSIKTTADRFVLHRNTIRSWVKALEGKGKPAHPPATYRRSQGIRHRLAFYDVPADELWGYVRKRKRSREVLKRQSK